jgi:hypothetical protein
LNSWTLEDLAQAIAKTPLGCDQFAVRFSPCLGLMGKQKRLLLGGFDTCLGS